MIRFSIVVFILCLWVQCCFSQTIYVATVSNVSFFSEARFENIEAHSKKCVSAINTASLSIAFKIPVQSFEFRNGLMQEHFNENYMESDKYPFATFNGKLTDNVNFTREGDYTVTAAGKLTIHGITEERTISGTILVKGGKIELNSSFIIPVSHHNIDIPKNKITNISPDISVKITAIYEAKK